MNMIYVVKDRISVRPNQTSQNLPNIRPNQHFLAKSTYFGWNCRIFGFCRKLRPKFRFRPKLENLFRSYTGFMSRLFSSRMWSQKCEHNLSVVKCKAYRLSVRSLPYIGKTQGALLPSLQHELPRNTNKISRITGNPRNIVQYYRKEGQRRRFSVGHFLFPEYGLLPNFTVAHLNLPPFYYCMANGQQPILWLSFWPPLWPPLRESMKIIPRMKRHVLFPGY